MAHRVEEDRTIAGEDTKRVASESRLHTWKLLFYDKGGRKTGGRGWGKENKREK